MDQDAISVWMLVIAVAGLFVPTALTIVGAWMSLVGRIEKVAAKAQEDLQAFKVEAMDRFVRNEHLDQMETRLIESEARLLESLKGLSERINRQTDRMDELLKTVSRLPSNRQDSG